MKRSLLLTFWALIGAFFVILSEFFIPVVSKLFKGSILFLLPITVFSFLGAILLFLAIREKIEKRLKKFLILTGASSVGFFASIFLHNVFYGFDIITSHLIVLNYLMQAFHIIFFIIAIFACPIGFLVGSIGSAILLIKRKEKEGL